MKMKRGDVRGKSGLKKTACMFLGIIGVIIVGLFVQINPVHALSIDLTFWNVSELNTAGDFVRVTTTEVGGNTQVTFQWMAGANNILTPQLSPLPQKGIDMVAWNGPSTFASGGSAGWTVQTVSPPSLNMDGFGAFSPKLTFINLPNGDTGAGLGPITFTLAGTGLVFGNNANGYMFAAHVQYSGNSTCSGFVTNPISAPFTSMGSNPSCGAVPEPTALMLLGSGIAGIGLWQWKRRKEVRA